MLREKRPTPAHKPRADPSIASPLRVHQAAFVAWTRTIGLAEQTANIRNAALNYFIRWCDARAIRGVEQIDRKILEEYQGHLFHYRKRNGLPLAANT